jgi:signal transduction histidine kinase
MRWAALVALLATLAFVRADTPASARDSSSAEVLQVGTMLPGVPLGRRLALMEDPSGRLGIADVASPTHAERFVRASRDALSLGFSSSAYWLRFTVDNTSAEPQRWLLELANPLLDEVTLYVPRALGGFDARETGDLRPFAQRDVAYRHFVFELDEPARGARPTPRTYFLRVASTGSVNVPMVAWSTRAFLEHQHTDFMALCMFYGVLLVMFAYSACVVLVAKQREYVPYTGYLACLTLWQCTVSGHTFQFLLPDAPSLVHRILPASNAATLALAAVMVRAYLPREHVLYKLDRLVIGGVSLLAGLCFVLPHGLSMRVTNLTVLVLMPTALLQGLVLVRLPGKSARLFVLGWGSAIIGALVVAIQSNGLIPQVWWTDWALQLGVTLQIVLLSSALADKLDATRADLTVVHEQLSRKLLDLSQALATAEQESQKAARETERKDEFLATMSHEFRTPLNPIINIPQALREEFVSARMASCLQCEACFELEAGERLSPITPCPECAAQCSLREHAGLHFVGDATRTRSFLTKIERSGAHLLQVVNGILEFSKLQAGRLTLVPRPFEVGPLLRDVLLDFAEQAAQHDVGLTCVCKPHDATLSADAARVRQLLGTLLDNAIKYSERGGYVTLRAELTEEACSFTVTDLGIGIAREHFELIFGSFEQVYKGNTRRFGGAGLGLSIARSLARTQGGELSVQSALGKGSTFTFTLPRRAGSALSVAERLPPRARAAS